MMKDTIDGIAKYAIAAAVIAGCFAIIYLSPPSSDNTQPWSVITLIVGWLIRDSAGTSATRNAVAVAEATNGATTPN